MIRVLMNNIDISEHVIATGTVEESAGEYGQLTITDLPAMTGKNTTGFWTPTNPASLFYGEKDITKNAIQIWNDGVNVFKGVVSKIVVNEENMVANVSLKSNIQKSLDKSIIYASEDNSNPSTIVEEICSAYSIPIDVKSFSRSSSEYSDNNVSTNAFYRGDTNVIGAIQQIAEIGCGRAYIYNQKMHFDTFRTREADGIITISDDPSNDGGITLLSPPTIENIEKEPKTGYKIEYVNGSGALSATLGIEEEQDFSLSAGSSNPIRINDLQSAVWIGDLWIKYFNSPQKIYTFLVSANIGKTLDINDPLYFDYDGQEVIVMDIIGLDKTSKVTTKVKALTR